MRKCKVKNCTNDIGGEDTKCGDLCVDHWKQKSSSSYRNTTDDPYTYGGGPAFDDPTEEEINQMKEQIFQKNTEKLTVPDENPYIPRIHSVPTKILDSIRE